MARMYPQKLPRGGVSSAERLMFNAFKEQLDDDFIVIHSAQYTLREQKGHDIDGEIDFLIAHPVLGVLVLEVKGGQIGVDGNTGNWYRVDADNRKTELRQNPVKQALKNLHALKRSLDNTLSTRPYNYRLEWGLAFPNSIVGPEGFGMEAPRLKIIDGSDLSWLERAVRRLMLKGLSSEHRLSADALKALIDLVKPSRQIRHRSLYADLKAAEAEIITLTEQQYQLLDHLQKHRRAAIAGCAGSGKTMLAMEKARRLANEDHRVLVTCYNKRLAESMRQSIAFRSDFPPGKLSIFHYHDLVRHFTAKAGKQLGPEPKDQSARERYYAVDMPQFLVDALETVPDRYDAIIVDEGQDFAPDWWVTLELLLRDPDLGVLYVFYDENQRIYSRDLDLPIKGDPFVLTVNCRNTRRIHDRVVTYYQGSPQPVANGLEGQDPEIIPVPDGNQIEALRKLFARIFSEPAIQPDHVVILTPNSRSRSALKDGTRIGNHTLSWTSVLRPNQVHVSTIHQFKGLESPIVILAETRDLATRPNRDELLYVALSRARSHLYVLGELPGPRADTRQRRPQERWFDDVGDQEGLESAGAMAAVGSSTSSAASARPARDNEPAAPGTISPDGPTVVPAGAVTTAKTGQATASSQPSGGPPAQLDPGPRVTGVVQSSQDRDTSHGEPVDQPKRGATSQQEMAPAPAEQHDTETSPVCTTPVLLRSGDVHRDPAGASLRGTIEGKGRATTSGSARPPHGPQQPSPPPRPAAVDADTAHIDEVRNRVRDDIAELVSALARRASDDLQDAFRRVTVEGLFQFQHIAQGLHQALTGLASSATSPKVLAADMDILDLMAEIAGTAHALIKRRGSAMPIDEVARLTELAVSLGDLVAREAKPKGHSMPRSNGGNPPLGE